MDAQNADSPYSKQASRKEANRSAEIDAARDLFYVSGYTGTSLAQIAKQANVSPATLFKHFPTKASVIEAVIEREWSALDPACVLHRISAAPASSPRSALTELGLDFAAFLRRPGTPPLFRLIIAEVPSIPELAGLRPRLVRGPYYAAALDILTAADMPQPSQDSAEATARRFVGLIAGQILWPALMDPASHSQNEQDGELVRNAVELVLSSLRESQEQPE